MFQTRVAPFRRRRAVRKAARYCPATGCAYARASRKLADCNPVLKHAERSEWEDGAFLGQGVGEMVVPDIFCRFEGTGRTRRSRGWVDMELWVYE